MGKFVYFICLMWFHSLRAGAVRNDICDICMKIEQCLWFANLNKHEQQVRSQQVPYSDQQSSFGISPNTNRNYVYCPESKIWNNQNIKNSFVNNGSNNYDRLTKLSSLRQNLYPAQNYYDSLQLDNSDGGTKQIVIQNQETSSTEQDRANIYENAPNNMESEQNFKHQNPNDSYYQSTDGKIWGSQRQSNIKSSARNFRNNVQQLVGPGIQNSMRNVKQYGSKLGIATSWQNDKQVNGAGVQNANSYSQFDNENANLDSTPNIGDRCNGLKSLLPKPATKCCGQDVSNVESITDLKKLHNINGPFKLQSRRSHQQPDQVHRFSQKQEATVTNNTVDIELDNRIAGGQETELEQFPWTTHLKSTFDYGYKQTTISCGGSLISSRYVLTAGHCVFESKARLLSVQIILAEFDKSTFPGDCQSDVGTMPKCNDNLSMQAEHVILHTQYDDARLKNDIALIRLQGYAPYTRYIRPICLPPINTDKDKFSNVPLAVAGWRRNDSYGADIKQFTVMSLVPHGECRKYYPYLSKSHLCASGRTGGDICKGDSGGPLMMLFRGSYYLVGIVSGKRADAPCGTSVPSLYTNVFLYARWIRGNISN